MEEKYTITLKLKNNETNKSFSGYVGYNEFEKLMKFGISPLEIILGKCFEMEKEENKDESE